MAGQFEEQAASRRKEAFELAADVMVAGKICNDEDGKPIKRMPAEAVIKMRTAHDLEEIAATIRREIR